MEHTFYKWDSTLGYGFSVLVSQQFHEMFQALQNLPRSCHFPHLLVIVTAIVDLHPPIAILTHFSSEIVLEGVQEREVEALAAGDSGAGPVVLLGPQQLEVSLCPQLLHIEGNHVLYIYNEVV